MRSVLEVAMAALFALHSATCVALAQSVSSTPLQRSDYDKVLSDPGNEDLFQAFLSKLPTVTLEDGGARRTYHVLEGDLVKSAQEVRASIYDHVGGSMPAAPANGELLVMTERGRPVFWPPAERSLTYAVDRTSFPSDEAYQLVRSNFAAAATDWVDVCPSCRLSFRHKAEMDDSPKPGDVTFIVTFVPEEMDFIAAAFFPNDPTYRRQVLVAPSYLTTSFDKVGVFRHEIGHILGYRHEQLVGVPGCLPEDDGWAPLTPYDSHSVMHYFCGGGGSLSLDLTKTDRQGHRALYR